MKNETEKGKETNPSQWIIFGNGWGGWSAWNGKTRKEKSLVFKGSFHSAVKEFEHLIGPYYSSR